LTLIPVYLSKNKIHCEVLSNHVKSLLGQSNSFNHTTAYN